MMFTKIHYLSLCKFNLPMQCNEWKLVFAQEEGNNIFHFSKIEKYSAVNLPKKRVKNLNPTSVY